VATVAFHGNRFNTWQVVEKTKESQWLNGLFGDTSIHLSPALDCLRVKARNVTDVLRSPQRVRYGSFEVDLRTGELWKLRRKLKITAQQFSVLAILLERPGEVIGRDELQRRLWPDTFVDVDHNLNTTINKIREILGDSAEKPRFVETLSRRGYRFIAPVEIITDHSSAPLNYSSRDKQSKPSANAPRKEGFWIAVLPFKVSGSEGSGSDLAFGLAEDIITGLSRFSYLRVISLKSTAQFSDKAVDVRSAGKELGARYVLDGSVRLADSVARVTAQLVDCASGANLWAESYRVSFRPQAAFDVLDAIVPRIVSTIADTHGILPRTMSEALRSKDAVKLSPYEAVIRSFAHFQRVSAEEHAAARAALERAVEREPAYPDALAML
jgi:TolB-like protein